MTDIWDMFLRCFPAFWVLSKVWIAIVMFVGVICVVIVIVYWLVMAPVLWLFEKYTKPNEVKE